MPTGDEMLDYFFSEQNVEQAVRISRHFGNRNDGLVRRLMARDGPYASLVTSMRDIMVEAAQP